jgi:predicted transcriptional regulator
MNEINNFDDNAVKELKEAGFTQEQVAEKLGITRAQVCHALRRVKVKGLVEFEDLKSYSDEDLDNFILTMKELQTAWEKMNTRQVKTSIRINETKPFGIAYSGDWHIGAVGVDYDQLDEDLNIIRDTEGLYTILSGDYKEDAIKHRGSEFEHLIQPGMQDKVVLRYMEQLNEKALAAIQGCHDTWQAKLTDRDLMEDICDTAGCVRLWHGGEVRIKVEKEEYLWRCRHKYPYQSSLNVENAMRRIMEIQGPCDVAAEGHLHNAYIHMRHLMGQYRILLRTGSYKRWDEHGQQIAGYKGKRGCPVVIMFPDEHRMIGIPNLRDGVLVLNAIRK